MPKIVSMKFFTVTVDGKKYQTTDTSKARVESRLAGLVDPDKVTIQNGVVAGDNLPDLDTCGLYIIAYICRDLGWLNSMLHDSDLDISQSFDALAQALDRSYVCAENMRVK